VIGAIARSCWANEAVLHQIHALRCDAIRRGAGAVPFMYAEAAFEIARAAETPVYLDTRPPTPTKGDE
jgi:hypothetical protein